MIYLVAPYVGVAREYCDAQGLDFDSVVVVTKIEDAQGRRPGSTDRVLQLPGADPTLFFELTVHPGSVKAAADIPFNGRLW